MASLGQIWSAYNDSDNEKPLVGSTSAAGLALAVYIGGYPSSTPLLTLTPSVNGVTITMLMTRAQTNVLTGSAYKGGQFSWALRELDSGDVKPLAAGTLYVNVVNTA
jgi:hypothetical protein